MTRIINITKLNVKVYLVLILMLTGYAQRAYSLSANDKALQKAEKLRSEADKLNTEALDGYLAVNNLRLEEKHAKADKLEIKAQNLEKDALNKYHEANDLTYNYYKDKLDQKQNEGTLNEQCALNLNQANELIYKANAYRMEGGGDSDIAQALNSLNQAYNQELLAIEQIVEVYGQCGGEANFEVSNTDSDITVSQPVEIEPAYSSSEVTSSTGQYQPSFDYSKVSKIQQYMDAPASTVNYPTTYTAEALSNFAENYRNDEYYTVEVDNIDSMTLAMESMDSMNYDYNSTEYIAPATYQEPITDTYTSPEASTSYETPIETNLTESYTAPDVYVIEVPINISKTPQRVLQKVYNEGKSIQPVTDEGLDKLLIMEFATFDLALNFQTSLGSMSSFIKTKQDVQHLLGVPSEYEASTPYSEPINTSSSSASNTSSTSYSNPATSGSYGSAPVGSDISYVVQVAASKAPLDKSFLEEHYKGPHPLKIREEEEWYKYQIGFTKSYQEAEKIKESANVDGAFIVAYRGVEKLKLWKAIEETRSYDNSIQFYVQIMADIAPASKDWLRTLYSGDKYTRELEEGDYFKYQVEAGNSYDEAEMIKGQVNAKDAFIVAYKNGQKIETWKAIQEVQGRLNNVNFYVQIAASKDKLKNSELERIYRGTNALEIRKEGIWYRYHVMAGNTYAEAKNLKNELNIRGSFIVSYKNNIKLKLKDAINATQ